MSGILVIQSHHCAGGAARIDYGFTEKKIQKSLVFLKNEVGKQVKSIENQAKDVISINWSRLHAMASMEAHELQNTRTEGQ